MTHNVLWQVSLSNGETIYEEKGNYKRIAGELSPWLKLEYYIDKNNLNITSLCLYTRSGQTFNLPSTSNNPKFNRFKHSRKPISYKVQRAIAHDISLTGKPVVSDHFTIAIAEYETYTLEMWVDEKNTNNSWVLIK